MVTRKIVASDRAQPTGNAGTPVNGNTKIYASFFGKRNNGELLKLYIADRNAKVAAGKSVEPLTASEFSAAFGANPKDLSSITRALKKHGLNVVSKSNHSGEIVVRGRVSAFKRIMSLDLRSFKDKKSGHVYQSHVGPVEMLDAALAELVVSVSGFHTKKTARSYAITRKGAGTTPKSDGSWTVTDLAKRFNFPVDILRSSGSKKTPVIALIELGGGWKKADNAAAAKTMGIPAKELPTVKDVLVDGSKNAPTTPDSADGEVALDIQACFVAIGAKILVVFAPNSDTGFAHGIKSAVDAGADVISISWGQGEQGWTADAIAAMETEIARADALGIPVLVASGDTGSQDGGGDGKSHVDYPSASAHSTGCGGLFVDHDASQPLRAWNDDPTSSATGGGVSVNFPVPDYQANANVPVNADTGKPGRAVCDVSADADPNSGVVIVCDGQTMVIGGTSFAAPFIAAGLAVLIAITGKRVNGLNAYLYAHGYADGFITDVTLGDNGAYKAGPGYDCPTGLGAIDFGKFLASLQKNGFAS